MTVRLRFILVALGLITASLASAVEYEEYFIGFTTELAVSSDLAVSPLVPDSLRVDAVSFSGTLGPASTSPFRFRAGLGWFPQRPFVLSAGVELPLYERLNRSRARSFGVYLLGDLGVTFPLGFSGDAVLAIQLPLSALGGLQIGVGVNSEARLLVSFASATGAYPIRSRK